MSNNVRKIYLCRPNLEPICELNGVDPETVLISTHVKDFDELTFTVDRYVNIDGKLVESNGYEYLNVAMYYHVQNYGFFRSEYPMLENDGDKETKNITAYSIQKEVFNVDWVGLKINTAEEDSQEMLIDGNVTGYAMPEKLISFHNPYDERFSLLHILISKIPLWSIGYVDPYIYRRRDANGNFIQATKKSTTGQDIPQTVTYSGKRWVYNDDGDFVQEEGTWTEPEYELKSVGIYDEDNISIYAFLTTVLGPKIGALFFFDTEHRIIHVVSKEYMENSNDKYDTGIYVGFRNLANSVTLQVDEDSVITRVNCEGGEGLNFLDINYGSKRLIDLSYFAHEPYMAQETAQKVLAWQKMIDDNRPAYKALAAEAIYINDKINDITYKVPSDDDYWKQWSGMNEEALNKSLAYYEAELAMLQESVDDTPQYDANGKYVIYNQGKTDTWYGGKLSEAQNGYGGYGTYYEITTYIIPNIKIALNNLTILPSDPRYKDPIEQVDYDWDLYGIVELENQIKNLENQYRILKDEYGEAWPDRDTEQANAIMGANAWNKEYYETQRQEFIKLNNAVGPNGSAYTHLDKLYLERDGTNRKGEKVSDEAVAASLNGQLSVILAQMAPYKKYYDLPSQFTEEELAQIYPLMMDTDYTNSNIAMQETDTAVTRVELEQDLLVDCIDKVSELSQPQISFTTELDNLYRIEAFKNLRKDLKLLNYIHLAVRDDYIVKLRVVGISWNPCDITEELTLEFSNMITTRSGRTDFTDILNTENNRGQRNSIQIGANGQIGGSGEAIDYLTNLMQALSGTGIFKKAVKNTVTNPISGVGMSSVTEEEFMYALKTVPGMSRFVLDTARASALDTDDVIMQGGKIKAGFINAKYIAVDKVMSTNYVQATALDVYSNSGTLIDLTTGAISAKNFAVDADGNGYFRGTVSSAKIISSVIQNAESNPTFSVSAEGVITSRNADGTSETVINAGKFTTNTANITGGTLKVGKKFQVDADGTFTCKGGQLAGWTIDENSIYFGTKETGTGNSDVTLKSRGTFERVVGGTNRKYLKFAIGSRFGVAQDGSVYCNYLTAINATLTDANVSGTITATAGTIGGCQINNGKLSIPSANISGTITANGINLGNGKFVVGTDGTMTASGSNITGTIHATDLLADNQYKLKANINGADTTLTVVSMTYEPVYSETWDSQYYVQYTMPKLTIGPASSTGAYIGFNAPVMFSQPPKIPAGIHHGPSPGRPHGGSVFYCIPTSSADSLHFSFQETGSVKMIANGYGYDIPLQQSDRRLKKNIIDTNVKALPLINSIQHREFVWKKSGVKQDLGYIAQEIAQVIPGGGYPVKQPDGSDTYQVSTFKILPYVTKAIQELSAEVDELKKEVERLRKLTK